MPKLLYYTRARSYSVYLLYCLFRIYINSKYLVNMFGGL